MNATASQRHSPHGPMYPRFDDEFPTGASEWPRDLSRRNFLQLMGASVMLAGLNACNRPPSKEIVPHVVPPEAGFGPDALYYSSAFSSEGFARGILVEAHSGRPTKVEGNPAHPESLGATDAFTQAAVLELYDPQRSKIVLQNGSPQSARAFQDAWSMQHRQLKNARGAGLAVITEPTTSPSVLRQLHGILDTFPLAKWFQHTALPRHDRADTQLDFDFAKADVVFILEADPFFFHPAALRYSREFASRRRLRQGKIAPSRLYVAEAGPSITGSMADVRLPTHPARRVLLLNALARRIEKGPTDSALSPRERDFIEQLASDLRNRAPNVLCVVGPDQSEELQFWAEQINARLGAYGSTLRTLPAIRSDGDSRCAGTLPDLVQAIDSGKVNTAIFVETNPVYTAPSDLRFEARLLKVPTTVHFGLHVDETASLCAWHVPASHFLESWSDLRAYDGTASIVQPLIEPMYGTESAVEFLHRIADPSGINGYEWVRETWRAQTAQDTFDSKWNGWLDRGLIEATASAIKETRPNVSAVAALAESALSPPLTAVIKPDPSVLDGRWFHNPWLQELPRPFTTLVWDNAAFVSPAFAEARRLVDGDIVALRTDANVIEVPIWRVPGQADDTITLTLGYGRGPAISEAEPPRGYDAYRLATTQRPREAVVTAFHKLGRKHALVSTQGHFQMEGRDLVRTLAVSQLAEYKAEAKTNPTLYPSFNYKGYAWAMSIDLSTCMGCNACVMACQAENNIPVVGKEQVARGREMHWLRIDRYFEGERENPRLVHQPVPCMHCENAPCELVCPVAATVHSAEGLNDMVYNRCVGTRYCSNNCPYKVRRFNFFDYRPAEGSPVYLQNNPDVTVRERGVMEKCTYCVQRINAGRIRAEKENRRVRDGEIKTACQQVCPVEAIVFGDLSDPASAVNQQRNEKTSYALLAELNTRPRTTYLARLINAEVTSRKVPVA